jgi:serine/threonine-protein kinase
MSVPQIDRLNAALAGCYTIERELGEGGMATVYLARDLKHDRDVALKVLRPELAAVIGAERFLAEIDTTAKLRHPHILPLFDSGQADSLLYYVMPRVEGETLRERLDRERQLPVDEAVGIAAAVASALQHAHAKGVVHRDIKPGNILIQDGERVVADFGVALALRSAGGARLTETGISLGTPHYMSPEQATGDQSVGPPTDIWALACVLYEMLAGEPPYAAGTPQGVLGKIIQGTSTPVLEARPSVPANVDAAIRRALEKVPADRFAAVEDFARALANPTFRHGPAKTAATAAYSRRAVPVLAALVVVLAGLAVWGWVGTPAPAALAPVTRLTAMLPQDHRVALPEWNVFPLVLSADGRTLAYVGQSATGTQLYVRSLDSYETRALDGTRGAAQPFFSPDGSWLAYFAASRLHRVSVDGGAPIPIARVDGIPAGGAWGPDDLILFADDSTLWRVGVAGGEPERIPWQAPGLVSWPSFLPAGAGGWRSPAVLVSAGDELYAVSTEGEAHPLDVTADGHGVYARGFLVYSETSGVVRAAPFDIDELRLTGTAVSVFEDVLRPNLTDATVLTLSRSGTLAYMPGTSARRLVLIDRTGRETELPFRRGAYRNVAVSPDGLRVLTERRAEGAFILDIANGRENAIRGGIGLVWSPSGREFVTMIGGQMGRFAASPELRVPTQEYSMPPGSAATNWGLDGVVVMFTFNQDAENRGGLFALRVDGDPPYQYETLLDTDADERLVSRSPDGRWIAYMSDASGASEIYARPLAGGESRLVSVNGGDSPMFSRDGRGLFYLAGDRMYSVPTDRLDDPSAPEPELLFTGSYVLLSRSWDVRPQGDFVMVSAGPNWLREILVVENWTTGLEEMFADDAR